MSGARRGASTRGGRLVLPNALVLRGVDPRRPPCAAAREIEGRPTGDSEAPASLLEFRIFDHASRGARQPAPRREGPRAESPPPRRVSARSLPRIPASAARSPPAPRLVPWVVEESRSQSPVSPARGRPGSGRHTVSPLRPSPRLIRPSPASPILWRGGAPRTVPAHGPRMPGRASGSRAWRGPSRERDVTTPRASKNAGSPARAAPRPSPPPSTLPLLFPPLPRHGPEECDFGHKKNEAKKEAGCYQNRLASHFNCSAGPSRPPQAAIS